MFKNSAAVIIAILTFSNTSWSQTLIAKRTNNTYCTISVPTQKVTKIDSTTYAKLCLHKSPRSTPDIDVKGNRYCKRFFLPGNKVFTLRHCYWGVSSGSKELWGAGYPECPRDCAAEGINTIPTTNTTEVIDFTRDKQWALMVDSLTPTFSLEFRRSVSECNMNTGEIRFYGGVRVDSPAYSPDEAYLLLRHAKRHGTCYIYSRIPKGKHLTIRNIQDIFWITDTPGLGGSN